LLQLYDNGSFLRRFRNSTAGSAKRFRLLLAVSHIHAVAPEGVFTKSGYFVYITETWKHRAVEIWQEKVFDFLVEEGRIDREVAAMIKSWRHTGFSIDNSVRIEADDRNGMQRLIEYICHSVLLHMVFRHIAVLS
jgi:hypothetical protein